MQHYLRNASNMKNSKMGFVTTYYYDDEADRVISVKQRKYQFTELEKQTQQRETRIYFRDRFQDLQTPDMGKRIATMIRAVKVGDDLNTLQSYYERADELRAAERKQRAFMEQRREERHTVHRKDGSVIDYITGMGEARLECNGKDRRDSFDIIRVSYNLTTQQPHDELMRALKRDIKDIVSHATSVFSTRKRFISAGIPLNYLEVSECIVTADHRLCLTFDIKKKIRDMLAAEMDLPAQDDYILD